MGITSFTIGFFTGIYVGIKVGASYGDIMKNLQPTIKNIKTTIHKELKNQTK